jgi:3-oxoacyl-[acyl-carrier protein] reductase
MLDNLEDKVALVTGASRGIGKSIAEYLAKAGITVVGTATTEDSASIITSNLQTFGNNKSIGIKLNISESESTEQAINNITATVGSPVILVNNAGITKDNLFLRMSEEEWFKVINANLSGVFRLTKSCIKFMLKKRWGRIINISSVVAFSGNIGQTNYAAAKAGLLGFSKSLAQEVASRGITVNTVAPGFIDTDMTKSLADEFKNQLLSKIPMGRFGSPEEVAKVIMFLISENSSYVTGNTIHVNGGMLMN